MTVPIKYFFYDQTSAPQCTGEVGKIDAILYACLVTGYNSRNVNSISVSNNVATVTTSTTHGYNQYDIIAISGANESVFNNEFTIASVPSTTTFTFAVTTGVSSATGTITCKIAPLGWTREYTGTNKSVYRSNDITSNRLYLRVDDTNAQYALLNMYETMTSVDVGTGKSTDIYWCKSSTANNTVRAWYLVGDSKRFYLMTHYYATYPNQGSLYFFGDMNPFRANDPWFTSLGGHSTSGSMSTYTSSNTGMQRTDFFTSTGLVLARNYTWVGGNGLMQLAAMIRWTNGLGVGYSSTNPFPSPTNNSINLLPIYVCDNSFSTTILRGTMPGYYAPAESPDGVFLPKDRTVVTGGRTYMAFRGATNTNSYGNYWIDVTGPW